MLTLEISLFHLGLTVSPPQKKIFLPLPYQDPLTLPPNLRNDERNFFPGGPPLPRYLVQHEISIEVRGIIQIQLILVETCSRHFLIIVNSKGNEKHIMIDQFFGMYGKGIRLCEWFHR